MFPAAFPLLPVAFQCETMRIYALDPRRRSSRRLGWGQGAGRGAGQGVGQAAGLGVGQGAGQAAGQGAGCRTRNPTLSATRRPATRRSP